MKYLSRPEELMLLALWQIKGEAYGNNIRKFLTETTGKYWSIGSVYVPLDRLEDKGYVTSFTVESTALRGGRAKRCYEITECGRKKLQELQEVFNSLWLQMPDLSKSNITK